MHRRSAAALLLVLASTAAAQGTEAVAALAEAIRAAVVQRAPRHDPPLHGLSLSMGIANADPRAGYDAHDLFARADAALYRAERAGRNRVTVAARAEATVDDMPATHRHL